MDARTSANPNGASATAQSKTSKAFPDVITGYQFFGTLPEYRSLNDVAEYISIDIHPTKSLLVSADKSGNIVVWNYESKSIVYRTSSTILFNQYKFYKEEQDGNSEIPKMNEMTNTPQSQMTELKSVQFFDNDTLQWSSSASYAPVASQYIIAIYEEGFLLIDYIAQTATEVRNDLHLQGNQCLCVTPISGQYLLVGTTGNLCVYNLVDNCIQTSVAQPYVTHLAPYLHATAGSLIYQHATNATRILALNSQNLCICWDVAVGANGEFISITPSFAAADGGVSPNPVNAMIVANDVNAIFFLAGSSEIIRVDLSGSLGTATSSALTTLGCKQAFSISKTVTVSATLSDLCEPLVPALPADLVPVVTGTDAVSVVNMNTKEVSAISGAECLPEGLAGVNQFTKIVARKSSHTALAVASRYGVTVLTVNASLLPPVVALTNATLVQDKRMHALAFRDGQLYHETFDLEEKPVGSALAVTYPAAVQKESKAIVSVSVVGVPSLELNADGSMLAVVSRDTATVTLFTVSYAAGKVDLKLKETLSGVTAFTWSFVPAQFATIEQEKVILHNAESKTRTEVMLPGESTPFALFGHFLLGVGLNPTEAEMRSTHIQSQHMLLCGWEVQGPEMATPTTPTPSAGEGESTTMEWKKHDHLKPISARLPAPIKVIELKKGGLLLLCYQEKTAVYRVDSGFKLLTLLNYAVLSAYYQSNCLFLATASELLLLLLNETATTTYTIAGLSSLSTCPPLQSTVYANQVVFASMANPLLPPVQRLPQGVCSLLQLFKGHLLVASAAGRIVCVPLNHPSLRFVMLMASGQVDMAVQWTKQIRKDQHDAVAYVLQSWGHIEKCLDLPGLSPSLRLSFQLSREDVASIVKIVKKGDLTVLDQADVVNVDYRVTPVDQLPGVRRAAILLAKNGKKEELKKLFKLCQKTGREEDAEFVGNFLYKEDPSLLLDALKKESKYHDAALLSKMNTKYHKELPDLVQAWNQQLKTEARSSSYLSGVEMVLEEGAKSARKAKTTTKSSAKAAKGTKAAADGRRRRRRG